MNNYCIKFTIYKFKTEYGSIKNKIDYSNVPVSVLDPQKGVFKSLVSNTVTNELKVKKFFGKDFFQEFKKEKDKINYTLVVYTEKDLIETEKEFLPLINKYLSKKLFFKPAFKNALNKRIDRILGLTF